MPLVGASPVYRPPVAQEPLHLRDDGHWSTDGLVGLWVANMGQGTVLPDLSPYNRHLTLDAAAVWTSTSEGSGLRTNAGGGRTAVYTLPLSSPPGITYMVDFVADGTVRNQMFMERGQWNYGASYRLAHLFADEFANNRITWSVSNGTAASIRRTVVAAIGDGRRHVVCGTYDVAAPGLQRTYVDGRLVDEYAAGLGALNPLNVATSVGYDWNNTSDFQGVISQAAIYARALTASEIAALSADPDLPLWTPRRGISLALVAVGGGAVLPMFGGYNLGKVLLRGANL